MRLRNSFPKALQILFPHSFFKVLSVLYYIMGNVQNYLMINLMEIIISSFFSGEERKLIIESISPYYWVCVCVCVYIYIFFFCMYFEYKNEGILQGKSLLCLTSFF